jgi:hypothetical protein
MINYRSVVTKFLLFTCILGCSPSWAMTKERLLQSLNEVEDFTRYSARPVQTASREGAFEALKAHLWAMGEYHHHMAAMYEKRLEISSKLSNPKKNLKEFLHQALGFDVSQKTSPKDLISAYIGTHKDYAGIWLKRHAGLTGEIMIINGEVGKASKILHPTLENSLLITQEFKKNFERLFSEFEDVKSNPEKYINKKAFLGFIDELWALRYGHALILPWTKSDEEIQKEKVALEKKKKVRLKRQRQKANKKAKLTAQVIENALLETDSSFRPIKILPSREEVSQEENKTNTVEMSLGIEEPLMKETAIVKVTELLIKEPPITAVQTEDITEQPLDNFDYELFVEEERQKSFEKKQMKEEKSTPTPSQKEVSSSHHQPILPGFPVDKESYCAFMDIFDGHNIAFKAFVKAFKNGLKGNVYKNKGGSIQTFQLGNCSFNLHKPHGQQKGKAKFYDDLRQYAVFKLGEFGVTKETLHLKE